MAVTSLLEVIARLFSDGDAADAFRAGPDRFLADHGLDDLSGADVVDALALGFDSLAPDLALRIVIPPATDDASAADALGALLDAAPADSVLADESVDLDFGLGDALADSDDGGAFNEVDEVALDLEPDFGAESDNFDDLDTATFEQGFGHGDVDVDHLHDVDDLDFAHGHDDAPDGLL